MGTGQVINGVWAKTGSANREKNTKFINNQFFQAHKKQIQSSYVSKNSEIRFLSRSTNHNLGHYWVQLPQKPSRSVISGYIGLFRGGMMCPRVPIFFRILLAFLNKKNKKLCSTRGQQKWPMFLKDFGNPPSMVFVCLFPMGNTHLNLPIQLL